MTRQEKNKMRSDLFNAIKNENTALAVQLAHNFDGHPKHGLELCIRYNQPDVFDVLWTRCASKDKITVLEDAIFYRNTHITNKILPHVDLNKHHKNIFSCIAVSGPPNLADIVVPYFSEPVSNACLQSAVFHQNIDMVRYILPLCDNTPKTDALLQSVLPNAFNEEIALLLCHVSDVGGALKKISDPEYDAQEGIEFLQAFIAQQEKEHIQQHLHATNTSRCVRKI